MKRYLLIDDDYIFNLIHVRIIKICDSEGEIKELKESVNALTYIKRIIENNEKLPDYIFLDLSMPEMNGFEILDELSNYPKELFASTKIYMVTSSLNEKDMNKAFSYPILTGYKGKPLNIETIKEIISIA